MNRSFVNFAAPQQQQDATRDAVAADAPLKDKVIAALRGIYDPEIPVNLYDLGLIYRLDIKDQDVRVVMTLTTPNCPVADAIPAQVECALKEIDGVGQVQVELTWDPPWNPDNLSDEVKLTLGLL
jgi:FeS assembly SUF system protein